MFVHGHWWLDMGWLKYGEAQPNSQQWWSHSVGDHLVGTWDCKYVVESVSRVWKSLKKWEITPPRRLFNGTQQYFASLQCEIWVAQCHWQQSTENPMMPHTGRRSITPQIKRHISTASTWLWVWSPSTAGEAAPDFDLRFLCWDWKIQNKSISLEN